MEVHGLSNQSIVGRYNVCISGEIVCFNMRSIESFIGSGGYTLVHLSTFDTKVSRNYRDEYLQNIEWLKKIISDKDFISNEYGIDYFDFSGLGGQLGLIINTDHNFTYFEREGLCARITTGEFLNLFIDFDEFLKRYISKKALIELIANAFSEFKKSKISPTNTVYNKELNMTDSLRIACTVEQYNMGIGEYVSILKFPLHLSE